MGNPRVILLFASVVSAAVTAQPCDPQWRPVTPGGPQSEVFSLAAWDRNGAGNVLIVGGGFFSTGNAVAQWNGSTWSGLGTGLTNGSGFSVAVYDRDNAGPAPSVIVVGGSFTSMRGVPANSIAVWDGSVWKPLGGGITQFPGGPWVYTLAQFGTELIAGGDFHQAGAVPVDGIARWDGVQWSAFTDLGVNRPRALLEWQQALYAGAYFSIPGPASGVKKWTGSAWIPAGKNFPRDFVWSLGTYKGELIAGGDFDVNFGPGNHVARFDGATWRPLGDGVNGRVYALTNFDPDGPGPAPEYLIAGGNISMAGGVPVLGIAAWDGQQWSALNGNLGNAARRFAIYNDQLVAGGNFGTAGGLPSPYLAFYGCAPCEPDCNGDGLLTLSDFGCFQTRFATGNMDADCNRDGLLQLSDFGCFVTKYALGCP